MGLRWREKDREQEGKWGGGVTNETRPMKENWPAWGKLKQVKSEGGGV